MSFDYKPPYTITSKMLDLTSKISEYITELKYDFSKNITLMLRKKIV